ncbi:MAG: hypothetical protein COT00_03590 [Candidatus Omnitrophica bacterium CG07_land_8_20_14_0_80_50_8]|nr:MAG: hypothetical protein COT00_03590 [Candidatus Omnitrophica bacterium CG07_land_8_20_14_0_80_50_8]
MVGFDREAKNELIEAIAEAERMTSGEIRVHVQKQCKGDVMREAKKVFHRLKMHKTRHHNAVLIYIAFESRCFAILGDRGIHHYVGDSYWSQTRDKMASYFAKGQLKEGIIAGILSVGEKLKAHFPLDAVDKNELSNEITEGD